MSNLSCFLHAARDARIEDAGVPDPGPGEVRLRLAAAGICGSDLHYYLHGGIGSFTLREPLILGHEVAAVVDAAGEGATGIEPGQLVAVNPMRSCGKCAWCVQGRQNLCADGFYLGSASKYPHMQGAFQQLFTVSASQCVRAPANADAMRLALAEPLSVALHAIGRASRLDGDVLVIGCGTIGMMIVLAARDASRSSRITAADVDQAALKRAEAAGADETIDASSGIPADRLWDQILEASGTAAGINMALRSCARGGQIVQVGAPPASLELTAATGMMFKEADILHSFRFAGDEFAQAVAKLAGDLSGVQEALGCTSMPLIEAPKAFELMTGPDRPAPKMLLTG